MFRTLFLIATCSATSALLTAPGRASAAADTHAVFVVPSRLVNDARAILGVEPSRALGPQLLARLLDGDIGELNASYVDASATRSDSLIPTLIAARGALDAEPADFWATLDGNVMTVLYLSTGRHVQPDDTVYLVVFVDRKIERVISAVGGAE